MSRDLVRVTVLRSMAEQLNGAGSIRDHELLLRWIVEHLDELGMDGEDCA